MAGHAKRYSRRSLPFGIRRTTWKFCAVLWFERSRCLSPFTAARRFSTALRSADDRHRAADREKAFARRLRPAVRNGESGRRVALRRRRLPSVQFLAGG